jgi:hypothetical protein
LTEEAVESAAGGVEGTLFLLGAVMKEWAAVLVDHLAEKVFRSHKRLAQQFFSHRTAPEIL